MEQDSRLNESTGQSLLDEVITAHGGMGRWQLVRRIELELEFGGWLVCSKFRAMRRNRARITLDPAHFEVRIDPWPRAGEVGLADLSGVRIETQGGEVRQRRDRLPSGHTPWRAVWDDLDELEFWSYALWNYATTPFLFAREGFETREGDPWMDRGQRLRPLTVIHPPGLPTHCRTQVFHFGDDGLLRRLDYVANVFNPLARAAHMVSEHRVFDGIVMPTVRTVHARPWSRGYLRWVTPVRGRVLAARFLT